MRLLIIFMISIFLLNAKQDESATMEKSASEIIGYIEKLDDRLDTIIKPGARIEVLGKGYTWSEGPVWLEKEQLLIWSDVPQNTIFSWHDGQQAQEYLKPSGYTADGKREGSNGLLLNADGKLVLCQHGDRRVALMDAPVSAPQARFKTIADNFNGKKFNSPNDAAFHKNGHLYFTDPPYGLPKQDKDPEKELPFCGVFRVSANGEVALMDKTLTRPNGIAFSPDFSKCYVANTDPKMAIWRVYDVDAKGTLLNGKVFYDATSMVGEENKGLPDGLKVNKNGVLFATGPGGVLVFTAQGEHLGTIRPGVAVANCAFNDDQSILFITAHNYVARVKIK